MTEKQRNWPSSMPCSQLGIITTLAPKTIAELRQMFLYLSNHGLYPRTGLGNKSAVLIRSIGPVATLRLRRVFSKKAITFSV